jgi:transposase
MISELEEPAQTVLSTAELVITTERVDDVALLLGHMIKMGLVEVLDNYLPQHWKQRGLSWGWTAVIWLAYILTEGDHRKVSVEAYVRGMKQTLSQVTGQAIDPLDFSDDRLAVLLKYLSQPAYWHPIEQALNERSVHVYDLAVEVIRCDATTVSADHAVVNGGLVQFGHSKDDPSRPQIKLMAGSLDPLGMPLATVVVSGERADDGLYGPVIDRLEAGLNQTGLLFVGDCKMSALETRAHLVEHQHYYLSPLPLTGATAQQMDDWISQGVAQAHAGELQPIVRTTASEAVLIAQGYEFERPCTAPGVVAPVEWTERVLVIHSPTHAAQQAAGLERRLATAEQQLRALTPPRGRGRRQITEEATLQEAIAQVLKTHRVEDFLTVTYDRQVRQQRKYVGRGRGAAHRPSQVIETVRYQITAVIRQEAQIAAQKERFGWKAFATNTPKPRLSLVEAVLCYRHEYRIERIFNRLKSRLEIAPLFVKRDDQIQGLTYLLTLGVRVLTVMEFILRRSLQQDQATLPGLHLENRKKQTNQPTAERVLKAFDQISLTILKDAAGNEVRRWLTPLSAVQQDILYRLGLDPDLYWQLEIQHRSVRLSE